MKSQLQRSRSASTPSASDRKVLRDRVVRILLDAEAMLQRVESVQQAKLIADVADAQRIFAKRQQLGEDLIGHAHAIKTWALARLGELLRDMPKAKGAVGQSGPGRGKRGSIVEPRFADNATYHDLGIRKKEAMVAQQLAALDPATRVAIAQREETLAQARRKQTAAMIRKQVSLPDAKFRVLYADPPWSYSDKADAGSVQSGGAELHYPSMTIAELCALPVASICEPNAVLFLWVTSPLLFESAAVFKAWGFGYRASFVWDKVKHNMGHYNSVRHEFLLLCTRGSCTPDVTTLYDSVQSIERTTHSTKPEAFRTIIETLYPHGKRLELFARTEAPGWAAFGHQAAVSA